MQYSKSAKSTTRNYLLLPLLLINIASPNMMIYHHINGASELLHLQCSLLAHLLQYNPILGQKKVATISYVQSKRANLRYYMGSSRYKTGVSDSRGYREGVILGLRERNRVGIGLRHSRLRATI